MANEVAPVPRPAASDSPRDRLDSWKEIAAYLHYSERTVRRWETEGLPVHRHAHKKKAAIYAYKAEIDAGWNEGRTRLEKLEQSIAGGRGVGLGAWRLSWPQPLSRLLPLLSWTKTAWRRYGQAPPRLSEPLPSSRCETSRAILRRTILPMA